MHAESQQYNMVRVPLFFKERDISITNILNPSIAVNRPICSALRFKERDINIIRHAKLQ